MLSLFLLLGTAVGVRAACPIGYTDDDGNCFSPMLAPLDHNSAYNLCAQDNAFLLGVINAFINSQIQSRSGSAVAVWLGLACSSTALSSCRWDSGQTPVYFNFAPGHPSSSIGACVLMSVATGKWYSVDCSNPTASFFCETTPGVTVPRCAAGSVYFNGYCYFATTSTSSSLAENYCSGRCGHLVSIHSDGENSFVRDLASSNTSAHYAFFGLQRSGFSYYWTDGTAVDYKNFGYKDSALGACTTMAVAAGQVVATGQWINSQCTSSSPLSAVCKKSVNNTCDATMAPPTTMAPPVCSGTQFVSGYGQLYSPGYPYGSLSNNCEYVVAEIEGLLAFIAIQQASLDQYSSISLYNSFLDSVPFVRLTNGNFVN